MNVCIVHDTNYGNGKRVAETLAGIFEERSATVTVSHVDELPPERLLGLGADLVVVGAAIRKFVVSPKVKRWLRLAGLKLKETKSEPIGRGAVFLTHALPTKRVGGWGRRFLRRLTRSGLVATVYPVWMTGRVVAVEGPLAEGAIERFQQHAAEIMEWSTAPTS